MGPYNTRIDRPALRTPSEPDSLRLKAFDETLPLGPAWRKPFSRPYAQEPQPSAAWETGDLWCNGSTRGSRRTFETWRPSSSRLQSAKNMANLTGVSPQQPTGPRLPPRSPDGYSATRAVAGWPLGKIGRAHV